MFQVVEQTSSSSSVTVMLNVSLVKSGSPGPLLATKTGAELYSELIVDVPIFLAVILCQCTFLFLAFIIANM